ncbi:MAG: excinuclease ABC subunit UvrC [Methanoregulaceae archaeon]|jgi:excinuclease ABC subunit C
MIDLNSLPHAPGCYLFSDATGTIIYIGKAKDLKKRITSYFQKTDHDSKTQNLIARIASLDYVVTNSEVEALLLENNLIKKHQPRYNIDLKDAKRFAYIELSNEEYPRIGIARHTKLNATYFGPFVSATQRDQVLRVVKKIFCLRSCKRLPKWACLRYHMHSCSAPCIGKISSDEYYKQVEKATALLKGKGNELLKSLKNEMAEMSARQEFEKALTIRDQITAVERLSERQHVERPRQTNQDIISYTVADGTVFLMVFSVEKGLLTGKQEYSFENHEDVFDEFLVQYYSDHIPPTELILPHDIDSALSEFLTQQKGAVVQITIPKIGEKKKLLDLVNKNISHTYLHDKVKVNELQNALGLPTPPSIIECFDISHISGTSMVGSMVQFRNGIPNKKNYRRFRIKSVEGIDDVASIGEVVTRRYRRLIDEGSQLPDLVIIDGGKGQLRSALKAIKNLNVHLPVIAIAKKEEEVYLPNEMLPRLLDRKGVALKYIQQIRDEAHRFAIKYHRVLRRKKIVGD